MGRSGQPMISKAHVAFHVTACLCFQSSINAVKVLPVPISRLTPFSQFISRSPNRNPKSSLARPMGQKQQPSDQSSDPKKRRRVGFSAIDAGVDPKDCIKIFLVSNKDEVDASESCCLDPIDLNRFFEEDGKIYGYSGLKITIWVSSVSFHAYADILYDSTSDGGKGITDMQSSLQNIFGETLVETKDDFLKTFSTEKHSIWSIISTGEKLQQNALNGHRNHHDDHEETHTSDMEAVRLVAGNMPAGQLYSRLIPLVLLLVDGSSPIDVTDSRWEMYVLLQKKTDRHGDTVHMLLGFIALYRFYYYPETSRLRLSQILVLPQYQRKGYGQKLLELLNTVATAENVHDVGVEEPLDVLQRLRTFVDSMRLLAFEPIQNEVNLVVSHLKRVKLSKQVKTSTFMPPLTAVENVRNSLKINKRQFLQCWEVLIYLGLDPVDKYMENFVTFISDRVRADILGRDSGTAGKKLIEVPSEYDEEMSFVMFKSQSGEPNTTIQLDENQANQEEQLQKLVDERVEEIKLIAEKVSRHHA